jgi:hypothetical protein
VTDYAGYELLRIKTGDGIARIEIDHPPINLIDRALFRELRHVTRELAADPDSENRLLRPDDGVPRRGGNSPGEPVDEPTQLGCRQRPIDPVVALGELGAEVLAAEQRLQRARAAGQPGAEGDVAAALVDDVVAEAGFRKTPEQFDRIERFLASGGQTPEGEARLGELAGQLSGR